MFFTWPLGAGFFIYLELSVFFLLNFFYFFFEKVMTIQ